MSAVPYFFPFSVFIFIRLSLSPAAELKLSLSIGRNTPPLIRGHGYLLLRPLFDKWANMVAAKALQNC